MGYCETVLAKADNPKNKTGSGNVYQGRAVQDSQHTSDQGAENDKCAQAWSEAYHAVLTLLPHNSTEEREPRVSQSKAQAQMAIALAEKLCNLQSGIPLPSNSVPSNSNDHMPPLAPQRADTTHLPPSSREPATTVAPPPNSADQPHTIEGEAGKHFNKPEEALKSWATSVWSSSKRWDIEIAGKLYKNLDGTWSYSPSYPGGRNSSHPDAANPYVWTHGNPLNSYDVHTHGSYQGLNDKERRSVDQPSTSDRLRSDRTNQPQFILTPGGTLIEWVPDPLGRMGFGLIGKDGSVNKIGNLNGGAWEQPTGL